MWPRSPCFFPWKQTVNLKMVITGHRGDPAKLPHWEIAPSLYFMYDGTSRVILDIINTGLWQTAFPRSMGNSPMQVNFEQERTTRSKLWVRMGVNRQGLRCQSVLRTTSAACTQAQEGVYMCVGACYEYSHKYVSMCMCVTSQIIGGVSAVTSVKHGRQHV